MIDSLKKANVPSCFFKQSPQTKRLIKKHASKITAFFKHEFNSVVLTIKDPVNSSDLASEFGISFLKLHLANKFKIRNKLYYIDTTNYIFEVKNSRDRFIFYKDVDLLVLDNFMVDLFDIKYIVNLLQYRKHNDLQTVIIITQDNMNRLDVKLSSILLGQKAEVIKI